LIRNARDCFKPERPQHFLDIDESMNSRRLTELTRNPAIYDAFLDGVRGTSAPE